MFAEKARFTLDQADRTREWCGIIARIPGAVIAPFNWHTAMTFWNGYMLGMDGDPFSDFREWGHAKLHSTELNLSPFSVLRRRFAVPADEDITLGASLDKERATKVARLMCDLVLAYVDAHAGDGGDA